MTTGCSNLPKLKTTMKDKKKRTKTPAAPEEEKKNGPPYRNIEEAKLHQVSSYPDIKKVQIKKDEHDFIICACDGIWDCFTNENAAELTKNRREKGPRNGEKMRD